MLYGDFVKCANHFFNISNATNDGWTLERHKDKIYLAKSVTQCLETKSDDGGDNNESEDLDETVSDVGEDDQSAKCSTVTFRKWQYHILHSLSYQVPVLYFNVWNSNGQLLSLNELWDAINPCFRDHVLQNKWYTLTQQEHPYLFKPFFHFHPCHTDDFMRVFSDKECNILITWLSSVGQVIWLNLNSNYGKMCFFNERQI